MPDTRPRASIWGHSAQPAGWCNIYEDSNFEGDRLPAAMHTTRQDAIDKRMVGLRLLYRIRVCNVRVAVSRREQR